jgi:hypothetical protein
MRKKERIMSHRLSSVIALALGIALCVVLTMSLNVPLTHAQGAVYYVDRNNPAASDGNPGTEALPWLTIQKAANTVSPGDTVYVKTGVYDERVLISRDGTPASKIIFKALPRRSVQVLHGFRVAADAIRVEGFDITHNLAGWNNGGVWIAGHDLEIVDNYIHDIPYAGIVASWSPNNWRNTTIADNYILRCNQGILMSGASDNWLVENNEIERLIQPPGGYDADYIRFFGTNHIIRHNYLHGTRPEEIGNSHTDYFQTFNNNGEVAHNILIEYNQGLDFAHQAFMMSSDGVSHSNITIRYNMFQGFTSWGVCAENIRDLHIYNNTWVGNGINESIHGVGFRIGSTGDIKNNIFAGITSTYWRDAASSYTSGYNLTFESRDDPNPGSSTDLLDTDPLFTAPEDILGPDGIPWTADDGLRLQAGSPAAAGGEGGTFIGAYEFVPDLVLTGRGADTMIYLDWNVNITLPTNTTWRIVYDGPTGAEPSPITEVISSARAYTLTGLTNYAWYTVTLNAMVDTTPILSDTVRVMPTDHFVYLLLVLR